MEIEYKYRESLKEFTVEENGYYYYMPFSYIEMLQNYYKNINYEIELPVEQWYLNLTELERKVVSKKSKDEDKLSSIW